MKSIINFSLLGLIIVISFSGLESFSQKPPDRTVALDSTLLPIFIIETNSQEIGNEVKVPVNLKIVFDETKTYQKPTDLVYDYNGIIGAEYRGNTSLYYPKKSYSFETWASDLSDISVPILGMPEEEDWLLLANYNDNTHQKNELMHWIWSGTGNYAVRTRHVELIVDGIYHGLYLLTEKIKRDNNRVDINKLKPDETSGIDLTGGYIVKRDSKDATDIYFWTGPYYNYQKPYILVYPNETDTQPEQFNYIKNYFDSFEHALKGANFSDPALGFRAFVNELTFAQYFIIQEFAMNVDAYDGSVYFVKDKGEKMSVGPVWDFDESLSNENECLETTNSEGWVYSFPCVEEFTIFWWEKFTRDCEYSNLAHSKFLEYRQSILDTTHLFNHIDSVHNTLLKAAERDKLAWQKTGNYTTEINDLKNWITQRLSWMDGNIATAFSSSPTINISISSIANFGENKTVTTNGCPNGTSVTWFWESNLFSGEKESSSLNFNVQADTKVYAKCNFQGGCKSVPSKPILVTMNPTDNGCLPFQSILQEVTMSPNLLFRKYQSEDIINISAGLVEEGKLLLRSAKNVVLNPGFETGGLSIFQAEINNCNSN